ncbi:MAG: hypothetical protein JXM73_22165 [Anaerolineae bacterium]|nr:hypothetical protein [Anaerolineae bacterium]
MFQVFFVNDRTATIKTHERSITIEQACVLIKKVRGRWQKVLAGVYQSVIAGRLRFWPVEIVLGAISTGERLLMIAQTFFKSVCPVHFLFRLKIGAGLDVALAW